ncbi:hypothetical protein IEO21_09718 [Rhodonia placenta]|uniref:Uncharacterized protein n=1 Tax=Rhodonia placenta TaxID=104341 RepID=A0A8H7TY75_9APHY|nr:hypothetical protein IEO21_09718 [Postia placenta]
MTGHSIREKDGESLEEPGTSGEAAIQVDPQFSMEGEPAITVGKIVGKEVDSAGESESLSDEDVATIKEWVSFVSRKQETVRSDVIMDVRVMQGKFAMASEMSDTRPDQFTKAHQCMKASEQLCKEKGCHHSWKKHEVQCKLHTSQMVLEHISRRQENHASVCSHAVYR